MEDCLLDRPVLIDPELAHARIVGTRQAGLACHANDRLCHMIIYARRPGVPGIAMVAG